LKETVEEEEAFAVGGGASGVCEMQWGTAVQNRN
jgi:hypothetical protein